ncbi:MAG: POTRA domain-containing protein [Syntrophobacteraceae bacterium]
MPVPAGAVFRARLPFIASVCLGLLLVLFHVGLAAEKDEEKKEEAQGIRYEVKLEGVSDKGLRRDLEAVLDTKTYRDRPPASAVLLERRAEEDIDHLRDALRSLGYYDHEVSYTLGEEKARTLVTFHVRPGEAYRFGSVSATGEPAELAGTLLKPSLQGFRTGDRATSRAVVAAEERLVVAMKRAGYAFAAVSDKKVIVDHASKTVSVAYVLSPGPAARFGPTTFTGLESVREDYPRRLIPWETGERYDGRLVDKLQKDLLQTRLFGLVRIIPAERLTPEGLLPMGVQLKE